MGRLLAGPRSLCSAGVFGLAVGHRLFLFAVSADALRAQEQAFAGYLTWQFLSPESFRVSVGMSMLYLQQGPPIPNLIVGLLIRVIGWPLGCATVLVLLEGVLSAAAGALLFEVIDRLLPRARWLTLPISLLFVLNQDLVVVEYNSLGQTFYEILAMTLMVALSLVLVRQAGGGLRLSRLGGVACALLALTRAPYSLVVLPALAATAILLNSGRRRHSLALLLMVAVLQGGWAFKNLIVYGTLSPLTSSWGGTNFTVGMIRAEYAQELKASILAEPDSYPAWFDRLIRERGLVHWHPPVFFEYVPADVRLRDQQIQQALEGTNRSENSVAQRVLSDLYMRANIRFALRRPGLVMRRFMKSYQQFWEPIRYNTGSYLALFAVQKELTNSFDLPRFINRILDGRLPERELQVTRGSRRVWNPASFWVPNFAAPVILLLNIIAIHALMPVAIIGALVSWVRTRRSTTQARFLSAMAILYVYAALTFNAAEYGENMRFRLSIEPIVWIISIMVWHALFVRVRAAGRAMLTSQPDWFRFAHTR